MASHSVEINLGNKHKLYNDLIKKSIQDDKIITSIEIGGPDLEKFIEIDFACHKRDMIYFLNILMGADMLFVSRAIKKGLWILEPEYAHIIEPEYLHTKMFPKMTVKAKNKLMKFIRINLKDEIRVEAFFKYEKDVKKALKWLPNCSLPFIKNNVKLHVADLSSNLFQRLCEKSIDILEIGIDNYEGYKRDKLQLAMAFSNTNINKYLDVIEKTQYYDYPVFNHKMTNVIMKHCSERIINNFEKYANKINIATFVKYLKKDNIKDFLYTQAEKIPKEVHQVLYYQLSPIFKFNTLKFFIRAMPFNNRFNFVKSVFIDKVHINKTGERIYNDLEINKMRQLYKVAKGEQYKHEYVWYEFASFDEAFIELAKLIRAESSHKQKQLMLEVLILCVNNNIQHLQILLQYYCDKHINDKIEYQINFVNKLLSETAIQNYDEETWNLLNTIFKSMDIYLETEVEYDNILECIEAIIVHNVLTDQEVPKIIEKHFAFNTLKKYGDKLNSIDKEKIFIYLYNLMIIKLNNQKNITNKLEFEKSLNTLSNILNVLKDWDKDIADYPIVLDKLKEFTQLNNKNEWDVELSFLYSFNKTWRKHMFEQSLIIHPSEEVCINALKHDPELLVKYESVLNTISYKDNVSLRRLHSKLRIYWPQTLAKNISDQYLSALDKPDNHNALTRGLCAILPQDQLLNIIMKYTPEESKVNWDNIDGNLLNLQKYIAKNMHKARPHPPPDTILLYAKGDYLQYALPSLSAIFHNLSPLSSIDHIPKLLNSPVSLQKHGIRFAFAKLQSDNIKSIFDNIWKTTKNVTIRAIIFKFTYNFICHEEDPNKIQEFWELFEFFIDNLSYEEDNKIYELLDKVDSIPLSIRPKYLVKCYNFLVRLISNAPNDKAKYEMMTRNLIQSTRTIMVFMCPDFITERLQELLKNKDNNLSGYVYDVLSAFLLSAKNEETQINRYENILLPYMQLCFSTWQEGCTKRNFEAVLSKLQYDLRDYVIEKKMFVPTNLFSKIQRELESSLSKADNYLLLTRWKVVVTLAKLINNVKTSEWNAICTEIAPELGKAYQQYLKEDVETLFPCIYILYSRVIDSTLIYFTNSAKQNVYISMLSDQNFIQSYLTVINITYDKYDSDNIKQLRKIFYEHPSSEVKMHYYYELGEEE
ncbi:uncharacterized protein LOC131845487 [Achroia grisella]|uniref:uncharacterized protein LOC131845487 n=1 Tax=Achroia grisella TaxID=688607 RepID=UPI0027D33D12|nr:uncharacterized protein LOC131845487 [Achroia grisella]